MIKVKMLLPYRELTSLKLNDRIIIRENRYIINSFTTDLTTFEVDFELIQDFRAVDSINSSYYIIDYQEETYIYPIIDNGATWSVESDVDGVIDSISTSGDEITINVTENTTEALKNVILISDYGDIIGLTQGFYVAEAVPFMQIANTGGSLQTCCAYDDYLNVYFSRFPYPLVNDIVYMDNGLSIPYNGQKMYHKEESTGTAYKISTIGKITDIVTDNC